MNKNYLLELAKKYETPFYIYNGEVIKSQYIKLIKAFENCSNFQVNYAIKALSSIAILKFIKNLGASVDAVSINEVKLALLAGYKPSDIYFTPNGVPFNEIKEALTLDVNISLDNSLQIEAYAKLNAKKAIAIRINPEIIAGANEKIIVANKSSKFGLPLTEVSDLHSLVTKYNLVIEGLHIHLGSGIIKIDSFLESSKIIFKIAKQFKTIRFINFGGGFKVKYKEDDHFIAINEIGIKLTSAFNKFKKEYNKDLKLIIEPGKYLVSESGLFLTKITTIKEHNVFVNSGFNHFIRPMYYDAFHQIENLSSSEGTDKNYNIVGYICEQDFFGKQRTINKPNVDDIICIKNAGAYCFTMASNYNSRLKPLELFYYNNETKIIRKKETFEDLIKNQRF